MRGVKGGYWFISLVDQDTTARNIRVVYRLHDSFYRGRNTLESKI